MWAWIVGWWRSLFGATSDDEPRARDVMEELRRARADRTAVPPTRSGRPRSLRTAITPAPVARSTTPSGEVPWYERQRRQAAVRDSLRDDYDEYRSR